MYNKFHHLNYLFLVCLLCFLFIYFHFYLFFLLLATVSKDITLINVANPTFFNNNLINFEKCSVIWKVCGEILEMQKKPYDLNILPILNGYFLHFPVADEQTLYDKSIALEPIAERIPE